MGLCKCERRKVTNLFCFEHRVNVCDHCAVADHKRCIIKSYLHWLQDSDYSPNCDLCKLSLSDESTGECVRLLCYDVFHWHCLNKLASSMPANTAPAGFTCPLCNGGIFPAANDVSPVAVTLRQLLSTVSWARAGLGLPILMADEQQQNERHSELNSDFPAEHSSSVSHNTTPPSPVNKVAALNLNADFSANAAHVSSTTQSHADFQTHTVPSSSSIATPSQKKTSANENVNQMRSLQYADGLRNTTVNSGSGGGSGGSGASHVPVEDSLYVRKPFAANSSHDDEPSNKYKRKSPMLLLARWLSFGATSALTPRELTLRRRRRSYMLFLIVGIFVFTLIYFGVSYGRSLAESDPLLDPRANPHIRIKPDGEKAAVVSDLN